MRRRREGRGERGRERMKENTHLLINISELEKDLVFIYVGSYMIQKSIQKWIIFFQIKKGKLSQFESESKIENKR